MQFAQDYCHLRLMNKKGIAKNSKVYYNKNIIICNKHDYNSSRRIIIYYSIIICQIMRRNRVKNM